MGKPRLIILIRHAQSEGNKNREIHQTVPDHRVKLTPEGRKQAFEAGRKLRSLLRPDDTLHFYTSPYRRTRETTEGILSSLTSDDPTPSPFPRHTIKVYEEPRLREQDFGNFQPDSTEMSRMWQERANYGHFFYRIPSGESAADAYDRISGFNESLWRSFGEDDFASVCVLVTHGLMTRVFLMKWYHWSVEYFEDLRNINHCEFIVMQKNRDNGKYILKNQLRTWTQYKAERRAEEEQQQQQQRAAESAAAGLVGSPVPPRKRYGDAPHDRRPDGEPNAVRPHRQNTADLFREDGTPLLLREGLSRSTSHRSGQHSPHEPDIPESPIPPQAVPASVAAAAAAGSFAYRPRDQPTDPFPDTDDSGGPIFASGGQAEASGGGNSVSDEKLDSPEAQTALMPTTAPMLHGKGPPLQPGSPPVHRSKVPLAALNTGRDGGGSNSGSGSHAASSDDDEEDDNDTPLATRPSDPAAFKRSSRHPPKNPVALPPLKPPQRSGLGLAIMGGEEEERRRQFRPPRSMQLALAGQLVSPIGDAPEDAMAEPLGDQSDMDDEEDRRDHSLQGRKAREGGFEGSVR